MLNPCHGPISAACCMTEHGGTLGQELLPRVFTYYTLVNTEKLRPHWLLGWTDPLEVCTRLFNPCPAHCLGIPQQSCPRRSKAPAGSGRHHAAVSTQTHGNLFDIKIVLRYWSLPFSIFWLRKKGLILKVAQVPSPLSWKRGTGSRMKSP